MFGDPDDDDTRAVDAFVDWMRGSQAAEMRRVAGFATPGVNGNMNGESTSGSAPVTGATTMPAVAVGGTTLESGPKNDEWLAGMFGISIYLHLILLISIQTAIKKVSDKRKASNIQ